MKQISIDQDVFDFSRHSSFWKSRQRKQTADQMTGLHGPFRPQSGRNLPSITPAAAHARCLSSWGCARRF